MSEVKLNKNKVTIVDDEDFEKVSKFTWGCVSHGKRFYARTTIKVGGKPYVLYLHRFIAGLKKGDGKQTDHINGNGLDNRKSNLRLCSYSENQYNIGLRQNNTSGYTGIWWNKDKKKWIVKVKHNKKKIHLGAFDDKKTAALAYNKGAIKYHGAFAKLNEITE